MDAMKAERLGSYRWKVLAIPFGGQFKGAKDAQGEFFSPRTDIKEDWFRERPVIWHHGRDPMVKDATLGWEDDLEKLNDGWWAKLWLDRGQRYVAEVEAMLSAGKAFGSSGSISHLVKTDRRTGEILTWPHAEQTLSTMPINLLSRVTPAKAVLDDFDSAGIAIDDAVKAVIADLDRLAADLPADLPDPGEVTADKAVADLDDGGDAEAMTRRVLLMGRALRRL